jgi:CO/xanthine dehydrogenase Mo-binding subunit
MVIADSRYVAEDAVRDVVVDIEPLEAVVDLEAALEAGAPRVHEQLESNMAAHVVQRKGDYAQARATADVIIARRFLYDRRAAAAIENRAVIAQWDASAEELTIWDTTQTPIPIRNGLAAMLGLLESQVRVVAPFVGGGFGPKIMMFYPEELLVPWAAMRLGLPIKWTEDRQESFYATTQERGQVHDAEMALTRDGRTLGVRATCSCSTPARTTHTASRFRSTRSARCSGPTTCRTMTANSPRSSPTRRSSRRCAARHVSTACS